MKKNLFLLVALLCISQNSVMSVSFDKIKYGSGIIAGVCLFYRSALNCCLRNENGKKILFDKYNALLQNTGKLSGLAEFQKKLCETSSMKISLLEDEVFNATVCFKNSEADFNDFNDNKDNKKKLPILSLIGMLASGYLIKYCYDKYPSS